MEYGTSDVMTVMELLGQQKELYGQLHALAGAQRLAITRNEPEQLLSILGRRQGLIDQLEANAERLRSYQQNWSVLRQSMSAEQVRRIDALLMEVNALLKAILAADQADTDLLAAGRSAVARELELVRAGRQAGAVYGADGGGEGGGLDCTAQ